MRATMHASTHAAGWCGRRTVWPRCRSRSSTDSDTARPAAGNRNHRRVCTNRTRSLFRFANSRSPTATSPGRLRRGARACAVRRSICTHTLIVIYTTRARHLNVGCIAMIGSRSQLTHRRDTSSRIPGDGRPENMLLYCTPTGVRSAEASRSNPPAYERGHHITSGALDVLSHQRICLTTARPLASEALKRRGAIRPHTSEGITSPRACWASRRSPGR